MSSADDLAIAAELAALARGTAPELSQFGSLTAAHQYVCLYRLWRRHVQAGAAALDWGAGNGHFSYFLLRAGYQATGYSLATGTFTRWLPDAPYRFVAGNRDPVRLPFADAEFDAVASVGVLEHVRDAGGDEAASLAEIARVLKPGGVFVCWHLPNRWSWIEFVARCLPGTPIHKHRYTRADVRQLIAGAGLELLETFRYAVLPRNPVHRVLGATADAPRLARAWDTGDAALCRVFGWLAQNHAVVARRPPAA